VRRPRTQAARKPAGRAQAQRIATVAGGGTDTVTVDDLSGTDLVDVEVDLVGSRGGGGDGKDDAITVNATNGNDVITVAGAAGQASVKG